MPEISSLQGLMVVLWALRSNKDGGLGAVAPRSTARTPVTVLPGRGLCGGPRQLRYLTCRMPLLLCLPWPPGPPSLCRALWLWDDVLAGRGQPRSGAGGPHLPEISSLVGLVVVHVGVSPVKGLGAPHA